MKGNQSGYEEATEEAGCGPDGKSWRPEYWLAKKMKRSRQIKKDVEESP